MIVDSVYTWILFINVVFIRQSLKLIKTTNIDHYIVDAPRPTNMADFSASGLIFLTIETKIWYEYFSGKYGFLSIYNDR